MLYVPSAFFWCAYTSALNVAIRSCRIIVEHFFANSADFRKYVVPLEALLAANDKFRRLICTKRTASMVITPGKRSGRKDILAMICAGKEKLLKSRKNIQNNIFGKKMAKWVDAERKSEGGGRKRIYKLKESKANHFVDVYVDQQEYNKYKERVKIEFENSKH